MAAGRRHPASKIRGDREKPPRTQGQVAVTLRSHSEPEARGSSWEEPPTPEAKASSWEEHPEECSSWEEHPEEWWLRRHRRA